MLNFTATATAAAKAAKEAQQEFLAEQAEATHGGFFPDSFYAAGKKARDAAKAAEAANEAAATAARAERAAKEAQQEFLAEQAEATHGGFFQIAFTPPEKRQGTPPKPPKPQTKPNPNRNQPSPAQPPGFFRVRYFKGVQRPEPIKVF